jgi:cell division inhibitor SepF
MSALQKVKAYFGMMPMEEYEDEYLEEERRPSSRPRRYREEYLDYPEYEAYEPVASRGASRSVVGSLASRRPARAL